MNSNFKEKYGEVNTPVYFVEKMFELLPREILKNKNLKWLDIGCGSGVFSIFLFYSLMKSLEDVIPEPNQRRNHIIQNMLYMVEINEVYELDLISFFGANANIYIKNYINITNEIPNMDIVIGNPPFNCNTIKKVPTNQVKNKRNDGKTIWVEFIRKSISILNPSGYLLAITPSIWMKPDKAKMYYLITSHKIHKLHAISGNKTNQIFSGEAQTPCCYFLLQKTKTDHTMLLYDTDYEQYIQFPLHPEKPIPVYGANIIKKLMEYVKKYGCLKVIKTNDPRKNIRVSLEKTNEYSYPAIQTCVLNKVKPELVVRYSNEPCVFHNEPKIVMAHGMYGFPYYDKTGEFGICNRDKFVIQTKNKKEDEVQKIKDFLNTKLALYIFESTRYRMKYLEKYAFEFIPNLSNLPNLPLEINDETLAEYFKLDQLERFSVKSLHKKQYTCFAL